MDFWCTESCILCHLRGHRDWMVTVYGALYISCSYYLLLDKQQQGHKIVLFVLSDLHKNFLTESFYGTQHIYKLSYNCPFEVYLVVLLLFFPFHFLENILDQKHMPWWTEPTSCLKDPCKLKARCFFGLFVSVFHFC